ncbi:hypothetical protein, partial [Micrococcus luteus]|uniref:hypothetical protein n=1 Tax=Micrococcus luteus TaxID=1270 RepID=UPI0033C0F001
GDPMNTTATFRRLLANTLVANVTTTFLSFAFAFWGGSVLGTSLSRCPRSQWQEDLIDDLAQNAARERNRTVEGVLVAEHSHAGAPR